MTLPPDLIVSSPSGLYCPPGDFHVDPHHRVPLAVITHAHGDHVRSGCSRYVCALPSLQLVRERTRGARKIEGIPFGQVVTLGATRVSFHPSGHILGSAQVRIEHDGRVWVVSGDYKRQPDPTCPPFEVVRCDTFVTEATFAHPRFVFDDGATIAREVHAWWQENAAAQRTSLLFTYPLGKTQRLLAELARLTDRGVFAHVVKNAAPTALAVMGLQLGYLLGGSILIETVFSWPGTGFLLNSAIFQRDLPLLQGTILVLAMFFVLLNLLVDGLQSTLDPRMHRG